MFEKLNYKLSKIENILIKRGGIVARTGLIMNSTGFVKKSTYSYPVALPKFIAISLASLVKRDIHYVDGTVGVIHTSWTLGYYHWLTESLPRLISLKETHPNIDVYLPSEFSRYEIFFDMLNFDKPKYYKENSNLKCKEIVLATCPNKMADLSSITYESVRDKFRETLIKDFDESNVERKIYITRKDSRGRKVINEKEVEDLLIKRGFDICNFDVITPLEQFEICSKAHVIVSIHGAALTNMMFMPKGGNVVELIPRKRNFFREFNFIRLTAKHDPCFYRLASSLGHSYSYLECIPKEQYKRMSHMDDIHVNIKELSDILDSICSLR